MLVCHDAHRRKCRRPGLLVALIASVAFIAAGPAFAVSELTPRFKHLSVEDGLSQFSVKVILQDSTGFMWFGTQNGLNRYDGYRFKTYKREPDNKNSLVENDITALLEDTHGNLWIGTRGGLSKWDPTNLTFTNYQVDPTKANTLSSNDIRCLYQDTRDNLWIGTTNGLNRLNLSNGSLAVFQVDPNNPHSLGDNRITSLGEDTQGNLWIGTRGGLNRYEPEKEGFTVFKSLTDSDSKDNVVGVIYTDSRDRMWIGSNMGLFYLDPNGSFSTFRLNNTHRDDLPDSRVTSICEDADGRLWFGTPGGLNLISADRRGLQTFQHQATIPDSLSDNIVVSIHQDRSGMLWVGTWNGGVNLWNPDARHFGLFRHNPEGEGLSDNIGRGIKEDSKGFVWITTEKGLNRFDTIQSTFTFYPLVNEKTGQLILPNFVVEGPNGRYWLATAYGLFLFDPIDGSHRPALGHDQDPTGVTKKAVVDLWFNGDGALWVITSYTGLYQFTPDTGALTIHSLESEKLGLKTTPEIREAEQGQDGRIWLATTEGLLLFDQMRGDYRVFREKKDDPKSLSHNMISTILRDSKNTLWVGTDGGGLCKRLTYDETRLQDIAFKTYTTKHGLADNGISGILEDDTGNLWLSTTVGISKFNPETEQFQNFGGGDGIQQSGYFSGSFHKSRSGTMYFGGMQGVTWFHPEEISLEVNQPAPSVIDFFLFNQSVFNHNEYRHLSAAIVRRNAQPLVLKHWQHAFSFEFAALHFVNPGQNRYAYRLEGFDEDWVYTDASRRFAAYTNLSPGHYAFRLKAAGSLGQWKEGNAIPITIQAPPWFSWWAWSIYTVIGLAAAVLLMRLRFKRSQQKRELLIEEHTRVVRAQNEALSAENKAIRDKQQATIMQEKMVSIGTLTAGIAHELKNPLNFVNNFANLSGELTSELKDRLAQVKGNPDQAVWEDLEELVEQVAKNAAMIEHHGKRADQVINQMMTLSRPYRSPRIRTDLNALLDHTIELAYRNFRARHPDVGICLENVRDGSEIHAEVAPRSLERAFQNILGNVWDTLLEKREKLGEKFAPILRTGLMRVGDHIEIRFWDNGAGIDEDRLDRVFNPFYTTKPTGQGNLGLGLTICYDIIQREHLGRIEVKSEKGLYSEFTLFLPD